MEAQHESTRTSCVVDIRQHGHKVVRQMWLPRAANMQAACLHLSHFYLLDDIFLCEHRKSRPAHSHLRCPPTPDTFFPFSTKRQVHSPTLRHPPRFLHLFNQETSWVASNYYFPRFLLEPSPRFMLQLSHFLPCLNQLLESTEIGRASCRERV